LNQLKGDNVIYAKWSDPLEYNIYYMMTDGVNNQDSPYRYTVEDGKIILKDPVREGYRFEGWFADMNYSEKVTVIEAGSTGSIYLYAKWSEEMDDSVKGDDIIDIPSTGDNSAAMKYCMMLLMSGIVIIASGYARRKKNS
jgi:uncharacterized repeat protein (TIGR02543 family)